MPVRPASPSLKIGDVYYVLFRHKWLILVFALLGFVAAGGVYFWSPPLYESESKVLVRYVRESRALDAIGPEAQVKTPDQRGESIISSEIEILTSYDLAVQVADQVGPEKILATKGGGRDRYEAAAVIAEGLKVDVPRRSSIIRVIFAHPNADVAQEVLRQLVTMYFRRHAEIHRAVGVPDDFLGQQTEELRNRLNQTEDELRKIKDKAGVTTLEESKRLITSQLTKIREELVQAEAELAQHRATLETLRAKAGLEPAPVTNATAVAVATPIDPEKARQYRQWATRLEALRNREMDLAMQFTAESAVLKVHREQVAEAEKMKSKLEAEEPRLRALPERPMAAAGAAALAGRSTGPDLLTEETTVLGLEARIKVLNVYLDRAKEDLERITNSEATITDLQRRRDLQESHYRSFSAGMEQARIDQALGPGRLSNINVVQGASVPVRDFKRVLRSIALAVGGGLGAGLALAFLLELVVDQSVRRPVEVEQKLGLPLFLSIPELSGRRNAGLLPPPREPVNGEKGAPGGEGSQALVRAADVNPLQAYCDALRDRVIMHFQIRELTHKPKLVGVTAASRGAGSSSVAAGLAQALSETGEGKVLLVDMNLERGPSVHPFYGGQPAAGLSETIEEGKRPSPMLHDNLYVVSAGEINGNKVGVIPKKFASLVPKMKASDYDYIIFDMPPVAQTSVTTKVAGLLDVTLLVLESERTNVEVAQRSVKLLAECRADVAAVLNKYRNPLPGRLSTDV